MNEKIINVFFGVDCLPYKDAERQVHYPILGGAFLGASNTTKIRFYYDRIGDSNTTWVSVAKLPNGKQGSQVLSKSSDSDGNYAELELNSWYTQAKGDVYIALQGYQGGVEYSYDSSAELYEIHGTPTIQTTGSIKLAINYAPIGDSPDYNDEFTTYQDILAALGDKANYENCVLIVDYSDYVNIQALYDYIGFRPFVIELYDEKTIAYFVLDNGEYYLRFQNTQGLFESSVLTMSAGFDSFSIRPIAPTDNVIRLTNSSGTLSATAFDLAQQDNAYILYDSVYYRKRIDTGDELIFDSFVPSQTSSVITLTLKEFYVDDQGNYSLITTQLQTYTKTEIETLLATKQNTLVNQVNIKSVNNQSLLGTGNIEIETGGGVWGEITGDIQDQTDLQAELQDIREVAEGKCKSYALDYDYTAPQEANYPSNLYKRADGTIISTYADFIDYITNGGITFSLKNGSFNSQDYFVYLSNTDYIITVDYYVIFINQLNKGDLLLVIQIQVPDRWYYAGVACKLETSKVDLTDYATKSELSSNIDNVNRNIAPNYDATTTYSAGEVVMKDGMLKKALVDISTPEEFDNTHWETISISSDFVNLTGTQTISGAKTFSSAIASSVSSSNTTAFTCGTLKIATDGNGNQTVGESNNEFKFYVNNIRVNTPTLRPQTDGTTALGLTNVRYSAVHCSTIHNDYSSLILYANGFVNINFTGNDRALRPSQNNAHDLGGTDNQWRDIYLGGTIYNPNYTITYNNGMIFKNVSTNANLLYLGSNRTVWVYGNIIPSGTVDIGDGTHALRDIKLTGNLTDGTNSVSVADLAALITYAKGQGWIS